MTVSKSKFARDKKPRRRPPSLDQRKRFLIVAEGLVTERNYFEELGRRYRMAIDIEVDGPGVPKTLVERAVKRKKRAQALAERFADDSELFDDIWCVFDVDVHPKIADAKQQARAHGIALAISNPRFELWALLHYQDQTGHIERGKVTSLLRRHIPRYRKQLPLEQLEARYTAALTRSRSLEKDCERLAEPHKNPSTGVHHLVELIRKVSSGQSPPVAGAGRARAKDDRPSEIGTTGHRRLTRG